VGGPCGNLAPPPVPDALNLAPRPSIGAQLSGGPGATALDERARPSSSSWCGTCSSYEASGGRYLSPEATEFLDSLARHSTPILSSRAAARPDAYIAEVGHAKWGVAPETSTTLLTGCEPEYQTAILDAIDHIKNADPGDFPQACRANLSAQGSPPPTGGCKGDRVPICYAGHALVYLGTDDPYQVVKTTLSNAAYNVIFHCYADATNKFCKKRLRAFTRCYQWVNPADMHIFLCRWFLDNVLANSALTSKLARVIAHEIHHCWGADEQTATAMEASSW